MKYIRSLITGDVFIFSEIMARERIDVEVFDAIEPPPERIDDLNEYLRHQEQSRARPAARSKKGAAATENVDPDAEAKQAAVDEALREAASRA